MLACHAWPRCEGIQLMIISNREALESLSEMEVPLPVLRGVELEGDVLEILVGRLGVERRMDAGICGHLLAEFDHAR